MGSCSCSSPLSGVSKSAGFSFAVLSGASAFTLGRHCPAFAFGSATAFATVVVVFDGPVRGVFAQEVSLPGGGMEDVLWVLGIVVRVRVGVRRMPETRSVERVWDGSVSECESSVPPFSPVREGGRLRFMRGALIRAMGGGVMMNRRVRGVDGRVSQPGCRVAAETAYAGRMSRVKRNGHE